MRLPSLFAVILPAALGITHAAPPDLAGIWTTGESEIILRQDGERLSATLSQLPAKGRAFYRVGELVFGARIQGNRVVGKALFKLPRELTELCPGQGDRWTDVNLMLAPTGRGMLGQAMVPKFKVKKYEDGRVECMEQPVRAMPAAFIRQMPPQQAELRFVRRARHGFAPVSGELLFGQIFYVEALFPAAPGQDSYTVTLDSGAGQQGVTLYAVAGQPELYRSRAVLLVPGEAPASGAGGAQMPQPSSATAAAGDPLTDGLEDAAGGRGPVDRPLGDPMPRPFDWVPKDGNSGSPWSGRRP